MKIYKSNFVKIVFCQTVCILSVVALHSRADDLPIQITKQDQGLWCWAAASVSVLNRYLKFPGVDVETNSSGWRGQCLLADRSRTNNSVDCCSSPGSCNYVTPSSSQIETILESAPYSTGVTVYSRTLTDAEVATQINTNKRPILAGLRPKYNPGGIKHMVVIIGVDTNGPKAMVMDPGGQLGDYYQEVSLTDLRSGTSDVNHWEWFETITMNANPSADAKLRYSYVDQEYSFTAQGNITAGPNYNVLNKASSRIIVPEGKQVTLKSGFSAARGSILEIYRE